MILVFVGPEHPTVWGSMWGRRRGLTINTAAGGSNPPRGARGAGRRWAAPGAAASRGRCPGSTGGRCAQASRRAGRWRPGVITRERGAYRTAEAGTRNQYVQYVGPWAQAALRLRFLTVPPCASGTYSTREAGARSPYVPCEGPGAYVSAQVLTVRATLVLLVLPLLVLVTLVLLRARLLVLVLLAALARRRR